MSGSRDCVADRLAPGGLTPGSVVIVLRPEGSSGLVRLVLEGLGRDLAFGGTEGGWRMEVTREW
jgi:hypothetical protein